MCVVSNVGDFYTRKWDPIVYPTLPSTATVSWFTSISREEFDALKRDVEEMKELLKAAKRIDELTGQPDCELDEKVELLKRVAEAVGISLEDVLG